MCISQVLTPRLGTTALHSCMSCVESSVFHLFSFSLALKLMKFDKKKGMVPLRSDRFGDRVKFVGNSDKNDLSIMLSDVQPQDEGFYYCNIINHPDRIQGRNNVSLSMVFKRTLASSPLSFSRYVSNSLSLLLFLPFSLSPSLPFSLSITLSPPLFLPSAHPLFLSGLSLSFSTQNIS